MSSVVLAPMCTDTVLWVSDVSANVAWIPKCWDSQDIFNNLKKDKKQTV